MIRLVSLMVLIGLVSCHPVYAAPFCASRALVLERIHEQYDEVPVARGMTLSGTLLEVFYSAENNTWTAIISTAEGQSCALAAGTDWVEIKPVPKGDPT